MAISDTINNYEMIIRLGAFFGVFAIMATWEILSPRRALTQSKPARWLNNLSLVALDTLLVRMLLPATAVSIALHSQLQDWGLLNIIELPFWLGVVIAIIVMDFAIYLQHVMFHALPMLWRLHRVHHADLDFDLTTGSRFHPIEILLSMLIKFTVIILLGPPVVAVLLFEILLNGMSMFNHSNVRLVHHSIEDDETNSNFGFNLSWCDKLFATYHQQPRAGHENMTIGIRGFRDSRHCINLAGLLSLPFIGKVTGYAINRRQWDEDDGKTAGK